MIQIGIDPAFRTDGFAACVIDDDRTVRMIQFKSFNRFLSWLWAGDEAPEKAICVVENSNLQNETFDMRGSKPAVARKSRDVGKNQAISQATYDAVQLKYGALAFEVSPKQKGKKWGGGKIKYARKVFAATLKSEKHIFLGDPEKVSQDKIDAYQLALMGKTLASFRGAKFTV